MSQIVVEAFARSLIDKIMLEAFDVADANDKNLQMPTNREESSGKQQSQPAHTLLRMQARACMESDETKTTELIEEMVHGLRNLEIGDSSSVPRTSSKLEKQIKRAVCGADNVSPADVNKLTETHGQGDVHRVIHDAVVEIASPICPRLEREADVPNEATRVSISLLHRMIEELETKAEESSERARNESGSESASKEKIAAWEETEEEFIRTIESVEEPVQENVASQLDPHDVAPHGISSSFVVHSTPFAKTYCLEEVTIEEIESSPLSDQRDDVMPDKMQAKSLNGAQSDEQKKKSILGRTRKLFRTIFGRRKK